MFRMAPSELQPGRLLLTTLVVSSTAALLKFLVAWETHSLALLADAAYSLLAVTAGLGGLLSVWLEGGLQGWPERLRERRRQAVVIMLLSAVLSLTAWEIFGAAYQRLMAPAFHGPDLFVPLAGLTLAGLAHVIWWLLVRQGAPGRLLDLSKEAAALQMVTTALAVLSLLLVSGPWTRWDAALALAILLLLARTAVRMVDSSLAALTES